MLFWLSVTGAPAAVVSGLVVFFECHFFSLGGG